MATPIDKYYTLFFGTITYCNGRNGVSFSNEKIQEEIQRVISEEGEYFHNITAGAHKVTVDHFSQIPNTQRENENTILTSEKQDKLDALEETKDYQGVSELAL